MNITAIHLYSVLDNPIAPEVKHAEFNLVNTSGSDSYIIKGMSGLDVDEVIHQYQAVNSGQTTYSTNMPPRVVVVAIRLNPKYGQGETTEVLRNNLQKMISYTRSALIEMRFMNGTTHVSTLKGIITKFESSLFGSEPEVQITFLCEDPFFSSPESVIVPIGTARVNTKSWTDNLSTAAHGFKLELFFPTVPNWVEIQENNGYPNLPFRINFAPDYNWEQVLYFSSEYNNRYVYYKNVTSLRVNVAHTIVPFSPWPLMHPGETSLTINTDLSVENFTWQKIEYKNSYWGV
jgi:hypothetical protein